MTGPREITEIDINGIRIPAQVYVTVDEATDYNQLAQDLVNAGTLAEAKSALDVLRAISTMSQENNGLEELVLRMEKKVEEREFFEAWHECEEAAYASEKAVKRFAKTKAVLWSVGFFTLVVAGFVYMLSGEKREVIPDNSSQ